MAFLGVLSVFSSRAKVGRKKSQFLIYWESWYFYGVVQLITSWHTVYQRNIYSFPNRIWKKELWFSFPSWLERASIWQYLVFLWIMLDIIEYSSTILILTPKSGWTCDVSKFKPKKINGKIAWWSSCQSICFQIFFPSQQAKKFLINEREKQADERNNEGTHDIEGDIPWAKITRKLRTC